MIAETITDVKGFMGALLTSELFDTFLTQEVEIRTYGTFRMDGHIQKSFYTEEELEALGNPTLVSWSKLRPICFDLIKGKKIPLSFRIIFCLNKEQTASILEKAEAGIQPEQVQGLFLNIRYEAGTLSIVTGTSLTFFTMDKSLEQTFDRSIWTFISTHFN